MISTSLVTSVQDLLDDDGQEFSGDKVARFLNIAAQDIMSIPAIKRYLFPTYSTSLTLTDSVQYVSLPTNHNWDVQDVIYNPGTNQRKLQYIEFPDLQKFTTGTVLYYTVRGEKIYFGGTPTAVDDGVTIGLWYSIKDDQIANDGNETTLGKKAQMCLIYRATQLLALTAPDLVAVSDRFQRLYDDSLQKLQEEADEKSVSEAKYSINESAPDAL